MAVGEHQDRVAVCRQAQEVVHRGGSTAAALVDHHHVRAELAAPAQHHHPRIDVGAAAGAGMGHDLDRLGWELVGLSSALLIAYFHERQGPVVNGQRVWSIFWTLYFNIFLNLCNTLSFFLKNQCNRINFNNSNLFFNFLRQKILH